MTPRARHFVTYYRVSTERQGRSGLGLDAQRTAVQRYLGEHNGVELASFREVESGKVDARPQLLAAMKRCRQTRATLLVAKLDRLSRNIAFLFTLRDAGVEFRAVDLPEANTLTLGVMAAMAQHEREIISARTKAALARKKELGVKLGNPHLPAGNRRSAAVASQVAQAVAKRRAEDLRDPVMDAREQGKVTLRQLAEHLNGLGIQTARGGVWAAASVSRLLVQLGR